MSTPYVFTPYLWPMLGAAITVGGLAVYGWRRRSVSGALPFAVMTALALPWVLGAALELAAVDLADKVFWDTFQRVWQLPAVTAGLWFALDYTNLNRWITRTTLAVLAIPPVVFLWLAMTNDSHQWLWRGVLFDGDARLEPGPGGWLFINYGVVLALAASLAFVWLFIQSPIHRRPVALCLCGHVATRAAFLLLFVKVNPIAPLDPTIIAGWFAMVMYGVAVFRFRLFDLLPVSYATVVEQMREGMLVIDHQHRIVDLNPAAGRMLGLPHEQLRGASLTQVVPMLADKVASAQDSEGGPRELSLGTGATARHYAIDSSPLMDRRHFSRGDLLLLHDVTEEKAAQVRVVAQQRSLATLRERERVARELHDSLGQVLGFLKLQAQAARRLVEQGRSGEADNYLAQLVAAAQDAHVDVREFIVGAEAGVSGRAFRESLQQCINQFRARSGIETTLDAPTEFSDQPFEPLVKAELLAIIQEALTNTRKHAGASHVHVKLAMINGQAEAVIRDDGVGFEADIADAAEHQKFGLRFMRERAEEVGGSLEVHSASGKGTEVIVHVPRRKESCHESPVGG